MAHQKYLQIQIDDVYACPGQCAGCVLTSDERRVFAPDMSSALLDVSFDRLSAYVPTLSNMEYILITFGIGDHLRMPTDYLVYLYNKSASLIRGHGYDNGYSSVFFTTSLIGKSTDLRDKLKSLSVIDDFVPFIPVVVVDPAKLNNQKYAQEYVDNIKFTVDYFQKTDLAINLSTSAIKEMSAGEFYQFSRDFGFSEVTVNWTPTRDNMGETAEDLSLISDWLIDFDRIMLERGGVASGYAQVIRQSIRAIAEAAVQTGDITLSDALDIVLYETISKSLQIDHMGNLLPKLEAIGDVTHGSRFGLPDMGSIKAEAIKTLVDTAMPSLKRQIMRIHSCNTACASCRHLAVCSTMGFHVQTHLLAGKEGDSCPHIAADLIRYFEANEDVNLDSTLMPPDIEFRNKKIAEMAK